MEPPLHPEHRAGGELLVVEHESDSGLGFLADAAAARALQVRTVTSADLPTDPGDAVAVVVLGASVSVNDDDITPWFTREVALLRAADRRGVPVLGVCFGAQALAVALGGSVARAARPEVGWVMVRTDNEALVAPGPWFQWHVDAIEPPPGATVLATTDVCVQAYTIGPHLAVQFHPEVGPQQAADWSAGDPRTLAATGQRADVLLERTVAEEAPARARAARLFDAFLERAGR